LLDEMKKERCD